MVVMVRGSAEEGKERARQPLALERIRGDWSSGQEGEGREDGMNGESVVKKYT